nr:MAG TPA: hypothetical protein [Caudoviricetes sp.]
MFSALYDDISETYVRLIMGDVYTLTSTIDTDQAHKPQYQFRFNLFKKNVESFESLFSKTSTVVNPYRYDDFRNDLAKFISTIDQDLKKSHIERNDVNYLRKQFESLRNDVEDL